MEALVGAYAMYVRQKLARKGLEETEGLDTAIEEGCEWLREALDELLRRPYHMQDRGPLESFQEAMRFPTRILRHAGHPRAPRDPLASNALPGDLYDLAPASSRELGESVWRDHLAWGTAKASAMTRRTVGILTRNLMDRSRLEAGLSAAGWVVVALKGSSVSLDLHALVVDLEHPAAFEILGAAASRITCLAYGPHVDVAAFEQARRIGADHTLPRSIVFRDTAALVARLG